MQHRRESGISQAANLPLFGNFPGHPPATILPVFGYSIGPARRRLARPAIFLSPVPERNDSILRDKITLP
jgi:hypothetical protein